MIIITKTNSAMLKFTVFPILIILFSGSILQGVITPVQAASEINCPDVFETDGTIFKFKSEQSAVNNPQDMRWGCLYEISLDEAKSKGVKQFVGFNVLWIEEQGPHYTYDHGCTSGEIFVKEELKWEVYSLTHNVRATTVASEMKQVSPVDVDAMLVNLIEQAEKVSLQCPFPERDDIGLGLDPNLYPELKTNTNCDEWSGGLSLNEEIRGKATAISGNVFVKSANSDQWFFYLEGMELKPGDIIKTGKDGLARIEFVAGDTTEIVDLNFDSEMCTGYESEKPKEDSFIIKLFKGAFKALTSTWDHGSIFTVEAGKHIQAKVLGTEYILTHDPDLQKTIFYLKDGIIDVTETTTGKTVELTGGQTLEINQGQMQPVSELKPEVWKSLVEKMGVDFTEIPDWIKNNAGWWAEDMIGDSDFVLGIQYLIEEEIMSIPETEQVKMSENQDGIPSWIKNNAGWWADGAITDDDFVKGIQYLVENGIMRV